MTYDIVNEPKFADSLDKDALVKTISDKANELLNQGLNLLPKNLNVNTSNVVNKSTLEHYKNWINNYQDFINKNKDTWIKNIANIASRGFAPSLFFKILLKSDNYNFFFDFENLKKIINQLIFY